MERQRQEPECSPWMNQHLHSRAVGTKEVLCSKNHGAAPVFLLLVLHTCPSGLSPHGPGSSSKEHRAAILEPHAASPVVTRPFFWRSFILINFTFSFCLKIEIKGDRRDGLMVKNVFHSCNGT